MSKPTDPKGELKAKLEALHSQRDALVERLSVYQAATSQTIPHYDAEESARVIARAQLQDTLNGTQTVNEVSAEQGKLKQAHDAALANRDAAAHSISGLDIQLQVIDDEIARVNAAISDIARDDAHEQFIKARDKLIKMAAALRDQVVITGAWASLADELPALSDIRIPAFLATNSPEAFYPDDRWGFTSSRQGISADIERKCYELTKEAA